MGFGKGLASTHLHQLHHVGVVQLLQDGDLLVDLFDGPFGLQAALRGSFGSTGWWAACGKGKDGVSGWERAPGVPRSSPTLKLLHHLRGKPACLISFFLERTFIACKRGKNKWDLGQTKDKMGLVGWGQHGAGQGVSGGDLSPIPPAPLRALGTCATHIVGVIVLIVGQLHHPIGALERGTARATS